ncbi:MAG: hypothetical protein EXR62_10185 [Chloroflexi bacterium]|nr:hypothetical protein [Chloroflexota bacterium]
MEEAITYLNQRGFIFFWPIKDVVLPSLWGAVAGNRPVAAEHDDPGHVTLLPEQAHPIHASAARQKLVELYFHSVGAARLRELLRLFPWRTTEAEGAVQSLVQAGRLQRDLSHPGEQGQWISVPDLL